MSKRRKFKVSQRSPDEIRVLRQRLLRGTLAEIHQIRDEWHGVHYRWWIITLSGVLALFMLSYLSYTQLGWYADHRPMPSGSDWLLKRIPAVNVLPVLSWGWFGLHLYASGAAIAYYPRRIPFLLFMLSVFLLIRTAFVFLSPIGPPVEMVDMGKFDYLFSRLMGTYTFQNEFIFSGHTCIPFLFYLFFETPKLRLLMLGGSITMAVCVLLSHNHYTVDVLAAYLVGYSIYALSEWFYYGFIRPLFQVFPSQARY